MKTTLHATSGLRVSGSDCDKLINLLEHFVHEAVDKKILKLEPVDSADHVDLLTKPLLKAPFWPLCKLLLGL